ncbi:MAG: lysophospholipase [Cyanobacteria bacterium P01_F01_bin.3]
MTSMQTHLPEPPNQKARTQGTLNPVSNQGTFSGSRALQLFYQSWYPAEAETDEPTPVKGVLALVHGLGEHSGRYCAVVKGLTAAGYAVFGFDNQGHGKSEGQRGHIHRWQDYRDNTQAFLQLVRQQEPTAPLFLMGHSLGGLIVLDYVLRSMQNLEQNPEFEALNIQRLVVSAPPIQPMKGTASSLRIAIARLLSGLLPRVSIKMGLCKQGLSRDQTITEQTAHDPLTHPYVTLRWGTETLNTLDWVKANIDKLRLPILLTHGEDDPIVAPDGTRQIFQQIQSKKKNLAIYPGSYHEPHNDLDAEQVVADLVNWLNEGVNAQKSAE